MTAFLIIVIVLLLFGVLGAVIKGVLWLALIGVAVIVASSVFGWFRLRAEH
ncbi:MAG: hypothetical protein WAX12_09900 [Candidatus Microthrix subdominans]|jgi:hypothetical protein|nr:hypothetical protein [Candidatus Microthrix sp.]MBK9560285.1 hypothetical protein [Candidatus Microthrix sp.]